jgi:hypothetical protein
VPSDGEKHFGDPERAGGGGHAGPEFVWQESNLNVQAIVILREDRLSLDKEAPTE